MNKDHEIYRAPEDEIPAEDKARLDGYLKARSETDEEKRMRRELEEALAKVRDAKEET